MAKRRKKHEKEPSHERWLVSYADFITLMFAFFVTMYSISRVDAQKFGSAVDSIHRALGSVVPLNMPLGAPGFFGSEEQPVAGEMAADAMVRENRLALERVLKGQVDTALENVARGLRVTIDERGLVISFPDMSLFEPCSAQIRPEVRPLLDQVARELLKMKSPVRVEGHTDNSACSEWPSNWELSTARASVVIRYLTSHCAFNPARLSAAGYADFRPVDTNDTPAGRARNRRVDIVILSDKVKAQEPGGLRPAPPIATGIRK